MTKEQAINYLYSSGFSDEQVNTIVKAFEPTTKNNSAIDVIVDMLDVYTDLDIAYEREIAENVLNKLSLVTPIRPKGHWIWCGGSHKCSNCEEYTCFSHKVRYCPNCGSDNREVVEE